MNPTTESEEHLQRSDIWNRFAWLPIPLLLFAIIGARVTGLRDTYESYTLLLILSFTFYTLASLGTLYLIGRRFLTLGSPGLLLLVCGVLLWSLAGTVGDYVSRGDANINVTIFNTAILLAGLCHLTGAIFALRPQRVIRAKSLWLGVGCAFSLGVLWLVTQASLSGWLPVFFIPGRGGTLVRYFVLFSAIAMFVLAAGLLNIGQRATRLPFTSWYSRALLLLAVGLFGVMIQLALGSIVNWLSRAAQWLGGLYLLFAAIASFRETQLPLIPSENKSYPAYYRDAVAVAMVLAAAAIRLTFLSAMGTHAPYLVFFPAVIFAALYGGLRAGLLATFLSAILTNYFWIEPAYQFAMGQPSEWLALVIFLLSGVMIAWVTDALHRARTRASAAETQALLAAEREATAAALHEGRAKLEAALASTTDAVFISDVQGSFIEFNDAFATFHRFKNKDECSKTFAEYPGILDVFMSDGTLAPLDMWAVPRALRGETVTNAEYTLRRKDTGETWVGSYSFSPIRDSNGAIIGSVVVGRDITDRKKAEEVLKFLAKYGTTPGEDFFQSLARNLAQSLGMDYVCIDTLEEGSLTAQTVAVYFDGKFEDNVVYALKDTPCGDVVEKKICCFPKDVRHLFPKDQVLQDMLAESYVGTTLWNSQGQPIGLIAVLGRKPLTNPELATSILQLVAVRAAGELERTKFEEEVRRQAAILKGINQVLHTTLSSNTEEELGVVCLEIAEKLTQSKFGFIGEINEKGLEDIAISNPGWDTCTIIDAGGHRRPPGSFKIHGIYGRVISAGNALFTNDPANHPDRIGLPAGHPPLEAFLGVPLISEGRTIGMIAVANRPGGYTRMEQDTLETLAPTIAEAFKRKRAQEKLSNLNEDLNRQNTELAALNMELEAFSYAVSHDLRAPLRHIDGFIRILAEDYTEKLDATGKDHIRRVQAGVERMKNLIEALLRLSRFTRSELNLSKVYLSTFAKSAAAELANTEPERRVDVIIADDMTTTGDQTLLRAVIDNLIGNAWKFTAKRPVARIEFGAKKMDGKDVFFVKDNGTGFDMKQIDKMFMPFQRLHTENEFPGIGIGLTIVQRIITRHGGRIWAEGEVEKGATFHFTCN